MRIVAILPKDRAQPGKLRLLNDENDWAMECPVLSKADNDMAYNMNNPERDPTKPWGDTPTGEYGPTETVWWDDHLKGLGEAGIPLLLEGATGAQAEAARANGRSGLYLHAGRGSGTLRPAYGCLRVGFRDFVALLSLIDGHRVMVEIIES